MIVIAIFGILIALILVGVPIAVSIGLASLAIILIFDLGVPLTLLPAQTFSGIDSFPLMAIAFFIFAGEIMSKVGITQRILDLADALVGFLKGGLTYVNALAAIMMATISGSGAANAAALGVTLIPDMAKRGYSKEYAICLTSCANVTGAIIPPSTVLILFAYYTHLSVARLFMGGVVPGLIIGIAAMVVGQIICKRKGFRQEKQPFSSSKLWTAFKKSWIALLIPAFIFCAIVFGWSTASEAGAVASVISLVYGIANRSIRSVGNIVEVARRAAHSTCTIFAMLAISGIFANVLVRAHFQRLIVGIMSAITDSAIGTMFIVALFIFIIGLFVDVTPMIIMFAAPFTAVALNAGVDHVHFGLVFVMICMVSAVTPPVGGFLFITTSIAKVPITQIIPQLIPFVATLLIVISIVILFPPLVTALPNLLFG